ncbi:MAG TPA: alpha/beta fold hydrolase [Xanthobacteraceae bacterium]|nr:alpha/beta fold hydrolase [Xanthobacteraceae bacterium]
MWKAYLAALSLTWCLFLSPLAPAAAEPFYDASVTELLGAPGSIIRTEPLAGAPLGASAFRVLYRSQDRNGDSIAVSGVIVVPQGRAPRGGRPVVAWAHGTTGIARKCAPSMRSSIFQTIRGLRDLLARGYVVTATDYPGLGTTGPHPYLVGISEGRAVLDSVRAARNFKNASASDRFALWGHSQGGHAVLFAGELAKSYAPELRLAGIAAAAPATELGPLMKMDLPTITGKILGAYALKAWSEVFGLSLADIVLQRSSLVFDRVADFCNETYGQDFSMLFAEQPLERQGFLAVDILSVEPWARLMQENTPKRETRGVPVFIAQGSSDSIVHPQVTANFMRDLCASGTKVSFVGIADGDHDASAIYGAKYAARWIEARFKRRASRNHCGAPMTFGYR